MAMDDSTIQELTRQLDSAIPREGAMVRVETDYCADEGADDPVKEVRLVANRAGYLRLGVACLQAAFAPYAANDRLLSNAIKTNTGGLFGDNPDDRTVRFERTEDMQSHCATPPVGSPDWKSGVGQIVGLFLLAFVACALVVGALSIIGWAITALVKLG